jgi:hypothetical protein
MRRIGRSAAGRQSALWLVALLILGISGLPAGVGTHGRTGQLAGGSEVRYTINGRIFRVVLTPGQSVASVAAALETQIDAAGFVATVVSDPEDPNNSSLDITMPGGGELTQLSVCENDANYANLGVKFSMGKGIAIIGKAAVAAVLTGGTYRLRVNVWEGTDYDVTFNTTLAANDTPAELNAAVMASLTGAGFTVQDLGTSCGSFGSSMGGAGCFSVSKTGDMVVSTRVETTDTGLKEFCISQEPTSAAIPTASQWGMFILVVLLTISAFVMMRRRKTTA